jgi:hypothetical protein
MRGAIHLIAIFLLAALATGGCATGVEILFDEREDLSKYQTWNWLPRNGPRVQTTHRSAAAIDARIAQLIEQKLLENGFRRVGVAPDFYVSYQLALQRRLVVVNEPSAIYELSSLHSSPSYVIEKFEKATHRYTEMQLAIGAMRPRGGTLWHASFAQNEREHHAVKLDDAVAMLLARFPRHAPHKAAEERRRRAICARAAPGPVETRDGATDDEPGAPTAPVVSCPERDAPNQPGLRPAPRPRPQIPS